METTVQRLLLQLDGDRHPSVFDAIVACDAGAEQVLRHGAVRVEDVRALVHGCIFTRGPKDLKSTAIFIGGSDVGLAEQMLAEATSSFFGPFRTSVMLDPNGSNTTAAAAVVKLIGSAGGSVKGRSALVLAGTGPVGSRAAGLLLREGAQVCITSRGRKHGEAAAAQIAKRFGGEVEVRAADDPGDFRAVFEDAELVLAAGPAGVQLADASAWQNRGGLIAAVDLNAVPPLGLAGIEVADDGVERAGVKVFGAIGVGGLKMKVHRACIARLFERNDLVLDAETIFDAAMALRSRPAVAAD